MKNETLHKMDSSAVTSWEVKRHTGRIIATRHTSRKGSRDNVCMTVTADVQGELLESLEGDELAFRAGDVYQCMQIHKIDTIGGSEAYGWRLTDIGHVVK